MAGPGQPKTGGRKRGTSNRLTSDIKKAILRAFDQLGGEEFLVRLGRTKPEVFAQLLGKLVPREVGAQVDVHDAAAKIAALNRGRERARKALEARDRARKKQLAEA